MGRDTLKFHLSKTVGATSRIAMQSRVAPRFQSEAQAVSHEKRGAITGKFFPDASFEAFVALSPSDRFMDPGEEAATPSAESSVLL